MGVISELVTSLKLTIISRESSMSLNIPSSLLVKFAPHSGEGGREEGREGGREGGEGVSE